MRDGEATADELKRQIELLKGGQFEKLERLLHELHVYQVELNHQNQQLREAQEALEASGSRYADLYDFAPVGYCTFDRKGCLREINLTGATLLGAERETLIGKPLLAIVHLDAQEAFFAHLRTCFLDRQPAFVELVFDALDGRRVAVQITSRPFCDVNGELVCRSALTDISDRIERTQLLERAELARSNAELASRAKDEFLAMLGHELRNPIAPIKTALDLMRMREPNSLVRERAVIERHVGHLVRLVDDLLDISRVTRGKLQLARESVAIAEVITKAIEMARPLIEQGAHDLRVSLPDRTLQVSGDPVRLAQVVSNLLNNASKYSEAHSRITVGATRDGDQAVIEVRDEGIGIPPELLPYIFERFAQGQQSLDRSQGGLGLGLAIAKSLVELHGGTVEARSGGPGKGSQLIIRLPTLATPIIAAPNADDPPAPALRVRNHAARVLVVDDNRDAAEVLTSALALTGHDARFAYDGPSALQLAAEFAPDVALLDIGLPVMDGYELARHLVAQSSPRRVRLVAITGYGQESDRQRSLAAGFDAHLTKPVDLEVLLRLIDRVRHAQVAPSPAE